MLWCILYKNRKNHQNMYAYCKLTWFTTNVILINIKLITLLLSFVRNTYFDIAWFIHRIYTVYAWVHIYVSQINTQLGIYTLYHNSITIWLACTNWFFLYVCISSIKESFKQSAFWNIFLGLHKKNLHVYTL